MTTATAKFSHNGTEIELRDNGKFYAKTAAGWIDAPSLTAIKKKIDVKGEFKVFAALIINGYTDRKIKHVTVIGIQQARRRFSSPEWKICGAHGEEDVASVVMEDTPANRKALQQWIDADKAQRAQADAERAKVEKLREALPYRAPGDLKP